MLLLMAVLAMLGFELGSFKGLPFLMSPSRAAVSAASWTDSEPPEQKLQQKLLLGLSQAVHLSWRPFEDDVQVLLLEACCLQS